MTINSTSKRTAALIGAGTLGIAALALGGTALASDGGPQGAAGSSSVHAKTVTAIGCNGGYSKGLKTRIVNSPFTFSETGVNQEDQDIPGATVRVAGPGRGKDTYLVTFSAETQLTGGDANDWMGLEMHVDGTPINPYTASGDVLAFTGEPSWNSNSMQFCVRLGRGLHTFQASTNLSDYASDSNLSGWLDDYTLSVQRFN
jgi:hypothetical protein